MTVGNRPPAMPDRPGGASSPLGDRLVGRVAEFDDHTGLGRVDGDDGSWAFHCTTIVDGSRTIDPDTAVSFRVGPGGPGRWEAFDVSPLG